jgi:replication-associated recombination protein RarA
MDQAQALRTDPEVEILEESVEQNLPEALQGQVFYRPSDQGYESSIRERVERRRDMLAW